MTDTTHTPGPWYVTPDNYAVYEKDGYGYRSGTICTLSGYGSTYDNRAANARLIAAAPELLAALQDIAEAPECVCDLRDTTDRTLQSIARAAIAKATGAQS